MTKPRCRLALEPLEDRVCLTVSFSVENGTLFVTGEPDGAVEISASSSSTYDIYDDGSLVGTASGVTRSIRLSIDSARPRSHDTVTLDLNGSTAPLHVSLSAGLGDDAFVVREGTITRSLFVTGSSGNDTITLEDDLVVTREVVVVGGGGSDSLIVEGSVGTRLVYRGGTGPDTLTLADTSSVSILQVFLAAGADTLTLEGLITEGARVDFGDGADRLTTTQWFETNGAFLAYLRGGNDTVELDGSFTAACSIFLGSGQDAALLSSRHEGELHVSGDDGNDSLSFLEPFWAQCDVSINGGAGSDAVLLEGIISGNLSASLGDGDDVVTLASTAEVTGSVQLFLEAGSDSLVHAGTVVGTLDADGGAGFDALEVTGSASEVADIAFDSFSGSIISDDATSFRTTGSFIDSQTLEAVDETLFLLQGEPLEKERNRIFFDGTVLSGTLASNEADFLTLPSSVPTGLTNLAIAQFDATLNRQLLISSALARAGAFQSALADITVSSIINRQRLLSGVSGF